LREANRFFKSRSRRDNVRLFDEVQAKTRDLSEALQQQTATADCSRSLAALAFDLQTVLETLARSAVELSSCSRIENVSGF
jgi:two-component system NtrC family sensor kinase